MNVFSFKMYIVAENHSNDICLLDTNYSDTFEDVCNIHDSKIRDDDIWVDIDSWKQTWQKSRNELTWEEFKEKHNIEMSDILDAVSRHTGRN